VRRKDFDSYLRAIAPEWERYERNLQLAQEGLAQFDNNDDTPDRAELEMQLPPSLQNKYMPPLDSVPAVFFQKDFNLGDPKTFADVTEQDPATTFISPQDDAYADPLSLSYSLPLLEKFSHYADTVEQHLVREIFIRSPSFFAALTNLRDLQSESERCLDRITKLRRALNDVDNNSAKRGLEMVRKESKMANLGKVRDAVKMIGEVMEMTGVAKSLVNAGQWGEALGVIEDVERLWDSNLQPAPDSASLGRLLAPSHPAAKTLTQNGIRHGGAHAPLPTTQEDVEQPEAQSSKYQLPPACVQFSSSPVTTLDDGNCQFSRERTGFRSSQRPGVANK
jgi:vacuolar protein sorting-associated protein 54